MLGNKVKSYRKKNPCKCMGLLTQCIRTYWHSSRHWKWPRLADDALPASPEKNQRADTHKTQVWSRKAERSQCVGNLPSYDRREVAPLTIMNNEDTDLDSMITTFKTAVIETVSEILGKHRQKKTTTPTRKKNWINAEIINLSGRRRDLRKERSEPEGSEKYRQVNNNIKRCTKKAKEN